MNTYPANICTDVPASARCWGDDHTSGVHCHTVPSDCGGEYLLEWSLETGELTRDDRPWQMTV